MRRSRTRAAVAAATAALVLAACGGGDGGGGDGPDTDTPGFQESGDAGSAKDPAAQGPAPEVEGAQEGGTITVLHPAPDLGPASLDPTSGWSSTDNGILQALVHRSLTTFREDEDGEMVLVPDLATDLGTPNDDYTEWQFTIKDGVRWETGDPVTAEDVAFGIKRSLAGGPLSGAGSVYSRDNFLGGEDYAGPYADGEDYEAVTVDGSTITIEMARPFPEMDYWGSFMAMGPVPSGPEGEPPGYGLQPMATGPYKVASFRPGSELRLVRNEEWDPATDPARHQYVDEWVMRFDQDTAATDLLVLSDNEESRTVVSTAVQGSSYAEAQSTLGDRLVQASRTCAGFWYPKYDEITDVDVRRALAFAYPYDAAWSAGGEIPGLTRVQATSILPPGMVGREEYEAVEGQAVGYDPEKSIELLAEAGYEPGEFEVRWVYFDGTPEARGAVEQIRAGLEEAGFATRPFPYSGNPYDVWTDPDNNIHQQINVMGASWCSDWPSGATFIPALFGTGQEENTGGFSEEAVDQAIAEVPTLPLDEQPAAWGEIDEMIMTEYFPVIPTGYDNNLFAYGQDVGNFSNDPVQGYPDLRDLYVVQ